MRIRTREELVNYVNRGKKVKYLFFWGHKVKAKAITKTCFSQRYPLPFNADISLTKRVGRLIV